MPVSFSSLSQYRRCGWVPSASGGQLFSSAIPGAIRQRPVQRREQHLPTTVSVPTLAPELALCRAVILTLVIKIMLSWFPAPSRKFYAPEIDCKSGCEYFIEGVLLTHSRMKSFLTVEVKKTVCSRQVCHIPFQCK